MSQSILFHLYLNNFLLSLNKIDDCNFADDITPFVRRKSLVELLEKLEKSSELAIHWLEDNYMKLNTG